MVLFYWLIDTDHQVMYPRTVNFVNVGTLIPKIIIETTEINDQLFPPVETN